MTKEKFSVSIKNPTSDLQIPCSVLCHWTTETLWWARSDYEVHERQKHNIIYPCDKMKNIFLYFFTKLKNSPSSVFSLILSMTGKINFQTSKATLLSVEFSILNSNKRYYRWQMLLVTAWKVEHCIPLILSFSKIDLVFIFQLALITGKVITGKNRLGGELFLSGWHTVIVHKSNPKSPNAVNK